MLPFANTTILLLATNLSMAPFISGSIAARVTVEPPRALGGERRRHHPQGEPREAATEERKT